MPFKKEFKYTGKVQNFTAPKSGVYLLEAWGAQGGNVTSEYWHESFSGGYGAYTTGSLFLEKGRTIYVAVGQGGDVSDGYYPFNGGGAAKQRVIDYSFMASGGGSTHFSYHNNQLKDLSEDRTSVILVAAGGGGAYTVMADPNTNSGSLSGGHAGGYIGSSPKYVHQGGYTDTVPTGGTQTRGGTSSTQWNGNTVDSTTPQYNGYFGQGGIYTSSYCYSGGGSGWFGGASGQWRAGAGGSSYIAGFLNEYGKNKKRMVCYNCKESIERAYFTISTNQYSYLPIRDNAKLGDGYAKITLLNSFFSCRLRRTRPDLLFTCIALVISS